MAPIFQMCVLAWKSGLKVPSLPFGPPCPLQTILLSDLVGCSPPLTIQYTVKKFIDFPVPRRDVTYQTNPVREKFNYSRQGGVW